MNKPLAAFVLILIIAAGTFLFFQQEPEVIIQTQAGDVRVDIEIADDPEERAQGLMHRESLDEHAGMLFVFDEEKEAAFWMRNTRIPLSIAYIDKNGTIVTIRDLQPYNETPVPSERPVLYALEVNQGFFEDNGIEEGDAVII